MNFEPVCCVCVKICLLKVSNTSSNSSIIFVTRQMSTMGCCGANNNSVSQCCTWSDSMKIHVFSFFLKVFKVSQFRISRGIDFHTAGAATASLRSANFVRVRLTVSANTSLLDCMSRTDLFRCSLQARHSGCWSRNAVNTVTASWYDMRWRTGSQWRLVNVGWAWIRRGRHTIGLTTWF